MLKKNIRDKLLSLCETPITSFELVGNWDKSSSFRHAPDRAILQSPVAVDKIHKQFEHTRFDFDLYFVNDPRMRGIREEGEVSLSFVRDRMGITEDEIPDPDATAITVIFTNNSGADRYMMSGWIIAHRIGHTLRRGSGPTADRWRQFEYEITHLFTRILDEIYEIDLSKYPVNEQEQILKNVAHSMATMKTARDENLRNFGEFSHELLAQYLTTGKIVFGPIPQRMLLQYAAYGRKEMGYRKDDQMARNWADEDLTSYAAELESYIDGVLIEATGRIFVI